VSTDNNELVGKRKKVLCPIERNGKTHWNNMGVGFVNKDNSINVVLNGVPLNGKLQIRDWDDEETYARKQQQWRSGNTAAMPRIGPVNEDLPF